MTGLLALVIGTALAGPTTFLPSAHPIDSDSFELQAGIIAVVVPFERYGVGGVQISGEWAIGDRVVLSGAAPVLTLVDLDETKPGFGTLPRLGVRYDVLNNAHFTLSPWVWTAGFTTTTIAGGYHNGLMGMAGLAFDTGGRVVRFDLSTSAIGYSFSPADKSKGLLLIGLPALAFTEMGVRWKMATRHWMRFGFTSVVPTLSYRYDGELWTTEVRVGSAWLVNLLGVNVGRKF